MAYCAFKETQNGCKCVRCGFTYSNTSGCHRIVAKCGVVAGGLGDRVERMLVSVGVTKDKWLAAKVAIGLPPVCGCEKRKAWLNKASNWWQNHKDE